MEPPSLWDAVDLFSPDILGTHSYCPVYRYFIPSADPYWVVLRTQLRYPLFVSTFQGEVCCYEHFCANIFEDPLSAFSVCNQERLSLLIL